MLKKADVTEAINTIVLGSERVNRKFQSYQDEVTLLLNAAPSLVFDFCWYSSQKALAQLEVVCTAITAVLALTQAVPTKNADKVVAALQHLGETTQAVKDYPAGLSVAAPMWDALGQIDEALLQSMQIPAGNIPEDEENIYIPPTMDKALRDLPDAMGRFQLEWGKLQSQVGLLSGMVDKFNSKRGTLSDRASRVLLGNVNKVTEKMSKWAKDSPVSSVLADAESILAYTEGIRSALISANQNDPASQCCLVGDTRLPPTRRRPRGNTLAMYPVKPFRVPIIKSKSGPFRLPTDGSILRIKLGSPLRLHTVDFSQVPSGGEVEDLIDVRDRPILALESDVGSTLKVEWNTSRHLGRNRIFVRTPQTTVPAYTGDAICIALDYADWDNTRISVPVPGGDTVHSGDSPLARLVDRINDKAGKSGVSAYINPTTPGVVYLLGDVSSGFVEVMRYIYMGMDDIAFHALPDALPDLKDASKSSALLDYHGKDGYKPDNNSTPGMIIDQAHLFWGAFDSFDDKYMIPSALQAKPGIDADNSILDQFKHTALLSYCPFVDASFVLSYLLYDAELAAKIDAKVVSNTKVSQDSWLWEATSDQLFGSDSPALVKFTLADPNVIDWVETVAIGGILETEFGRLYITDVDYTEGAQSMTCLPYGPYAAENPFSGVGTVAGDVLEEYFTIQPKATDENSVIKLEGDAAIFEALGITEGTYQPTADSFVIAGRPHGGTKRKVVVRPQQYGIEVGSFISLLDPPLEFTVTSITPPLEPIDLPEIEPPDNGWSIVIHSTLLTENGPWTTHASHFAAYSGAAWKSLKKLIPHYLAGPMQLIDTSIVQGVKYAGEKYAQYDGTLHGGGHGPASGPGLHTAPPSINTDPAGAVENYIDKGNLSAADVDMRIWSGALNGLYGPNDFGWIVDGLLTVGVLLDGTDSEFTGEAGFLTGYTKPTGELDIDVEATLSRFNVEATLSDVLGEFTEPTANNKTTIDGILNGLLDGGYDRAATALELGDFDSFFGMNEMTARTFGAMMSMSIAAGQLIQAQQGMQQAQAGGMAGSGFTGELGGQPIR